MGFSKLSYNSFNLADNSTQLCSLSNSSRPKLSLIELRQSVRVHQGLILACVNPVYSLPSPLTFFTWSQSCLLYTSPSPRD